VGVRAAIGARLGSALIVPADTPGALIALRAGLAVRSLDLVGASSHAPVMLLERPPLVAIGEPLPDGCDAVIDPHAAQTVGPLLEIAENVEPGAHVRFAGHDARAGVRLANAGDRLTAEAALACELAGITEVDLLAVPVHLTLPAGPIEAWIRHHLPAWGGTLSAAADAWIHIGPAAPDTPPRVALVPGETTTLERRGAVIHLALPTRFDGALAAVVAFLWPMLAHLTESRIATREAVLTRKISSRVGSTELVLVALEGAQATPLGVGDLTLVHLAHAQAVALLAPEQEGHAGGERLLVTPLDEPLIATTPRLDPPR
jgi:molybdopterin molybdotransferase